MPTDLRPNQRIELADLVIEHIYQRTTVDNEDKNGKSFPKYSKEYTKSLDFKNAGKSPGKVDLQLSGDMLAAMKMLNQKNGEIVIGFERGSEENAKADGNIRGTYGKSSGDKSKARDFLGIESSKLKELIEYVRRDETA